MFLAVHPSEPRQFEPAMKPETLMSQGDSTDEDRRIIAVSSKGIFIGEANYV